MRKKIISAIIILIVSVGLFLAYLYAEDQKILWLVLLCGSLFALMIECFWDKIKDLFNNEKTWKGQLTQLIKSKKIKESDYIRISFAYLYKIHINGKYLLVKNGRNIAKYQPVGGAYKCNAAEKIVLTGNKFGVLDDDFISIDETSKDDYRMRVPAKNLKRFVRRFNKSKQRETVNDVSREFREELLCTNILKKKNFKFLKYRYCGRNYTEIRYSKYNDCYEFLIADIVELLPSTIQEKELIKLQSISSDKYYWANEKEITNCGIKKGTKDMTPTITDHTFKILANADSQLSNSNNEIYEVKINFNNIFATN